MGIWERIKRFFLRSACRDRRLRCVQCGREFIFEAGEQAFFKEKGFQDPKRCPPCRQQHHGGGRRHRR
jgi:hypothetical protein